MGTRIPARVLITVGVISSISMFVLGLFVLVTIRESPFVFWVFAAVLVFLVWWDIAFHLRLRRAKKAPDSY